MRGKYAQYHQRSYILLGLGDTDIHPFIYKEHFMNTVFPRLVFWRPSLKDGDTVYDEAARTQKALEFVRYMSIHQSRTYKSRLLSTEGKSLGNLPSPRQPSFRIPALSALMPLLLIIDTPSLFQQPSKGMNPESRSLPSDCSSPFG